MQLDLNLLTALDALLEEGSVGTAAERLRLSEPAMSRTLGRIRRVTGDQILVRTGRTMTPTPYALAVRATVHTLVQQAHAVLAPERDLELGTLERTFTLRCHDAVTTAIGPGLLAAVQAQATGVRLRFLGETTTDSNDLRHGQVDLEIGSSEPDLPEIRFETIGHDRLVAVVRPEHPCAHGKLTLKRYANAQHITVSRRGRLHDPIDEALERLGLRRRVIASAPTSTSALQFIGQTDLMVSVPQFIAQPMVIALGLRTRPIPLELQSVPVIQAWHQRYDGDRAHVWLRGLVKTMLQAVCDPGG
jgi:DNA-binding transcriptional LysR family regulator